MSLAIVLALVVFMLGALVLYLKLRPEPASSSLAGSFMRSARQAVAEQPDNPWAHVGLGVALLRAEDRQGALGEFEAALDLDKTNWQANMQLAALIKDDDPKRALSLLEIAAKHSPSAETPYLLLGKLNYELGKYEDAKVAFLRSVALEQGMYDSRFGLAQTYEALGEKKLALGQYKAALRLLPGDEAAKDAIDNLESGGSGSDVRATPSPQETPSP